jgi:glycosyltransferase involved in cell wall biosynthesis
MHSFRTEDTRQASGRKVSLIIPFFNEEGNVGRVVHGVLGVFRDSGWRLELVCVQNGSADSTSEILTELARNNPEVRVVNVVSNRGYGFGIRQGLDVAGGDIVGYADGDGQILPGDILGVLDQMKDGRAIKGSRVSRQDGWRRRWISLGFNQLFRTAFGINSRDINAKPKFMTRENLRAMRLSSDGWFIDAELMLKSASLGIEWEEVPVVFVRRRHGSSSVQYSTLWEFVASFLSWKFGGRITLWKNKPLT